MKIKGNGTIRPVKNNNGQKVKNSWQLILSLGNDPLTNKRIQKCRGFKGTKAEARRALESFRREIESGLKFDADKVEFNEYATQWIKARESAKTLAPATIKRDKEVLVHINKYLRGIPLISIDPPTVRNLYIHLAEDGIGQSSIVRISTTLKQILKQAVIDGIILRNPCDLVETPKQKKSKVGRALDKNGVAELVSALDKLETKVYPFAQATQQKKMIDMAHITAIRLILATGLRQGELLALSWSDINFSNRILAVRHTVDKITGTLKAPKTESGIRDISLDEQIISDLLRWHTMQSNYLNTLGIEQGSSTPLITNEAGIRLDTSGLERWWRSFREQGEFRGKFHNLRLHDLRHTHATMLVSSGLNIKAVSSRLGHASVGITLDLYSHAQREDDEKAARIMGDLMTRK